MFSELFAPVSIGVRTIAKTVRILERNQDGTNQQASVVEVFKKRTSQTTPTEPHKNFAKKKIEEIQQEENLKVRRKN